ncbi:MAG: PadR family transcriptional regulator [Candidatus Heimdallarchaeota archaeon]|nr:PadR family transcriptional regulator [Candidatus Heimdallarchaeota archaeon]
MWLNSVRSMIDNKPLSPVELLVLATASDQAMNASQLMDKLNSSTLMWQGAAGTLYPILHRLNKRGLLFKSGARGTDFSRTDTGRRILSHSLNPIKSQMKETNNYYLTILELVISMKSSPIGLHDFMADIEKEGTAFLEEIRRLKEVAISIPDDSVEVKIDFD